MTERQDPARPSRRCRAVLGITPTELQVVVAVMACERAEGGCPTKRAIGDIVSCADAVPSQLVTRGWLERAGTSGLLALYRATPMAFERLGVELPLRIEGVAA